MNIEVLPYSDEAERTVLGAILTGDVIDDIIAEAGLSEKDFFLTQNKDIFKAMMLLYEQNKPIDFVTVSGILAGNPNFGGVEYLKQIANSVVTTKSAKYYADIVKDRSDRRKYIDVANQINDMVHDTTITTDEILSEIERRLDNGDNYSELVTMADLIPLIYKRIVDSCDNKGKIPGQKTGFPSIDAKIGGLEKGTLTIIAGRPGMGKSILGQNIAEYVTYKDNKAAIIFSLEMPNEQVGMRMFSSQTGLKYSDFRYGTLSNDDFASPTLKKTVDNPNNLKLYIEQNSYIDLNRMKSISRHVKHRHGEIGVIVVDYLQLMVSKNNRANRAEQVSEISRGLKCLAKELKCPIVALSQLSRENEKRSGNKKRPELSDLRESGSIEQDADTVLMIYREDYYTPHSEPTGIAEIIVAKLREGRTGTVKLSWQPQIMRFMEIKEVEEMRKKEK